MSGGILAENVDSLLQRYAYQILGVERHERQIPVGRVEESEGLDKDFDVP